MSMQPLTEDICGQRLFCGRSCRCKDALCCRLKSFAIGLPENTVKVEYNIVKGQSPIADAKTKMYIVDRKCVLLSLYYICGV